eukprot:6299424-Prorocentrum_lima.AAC.1
MGSRPSGTTPLSEPPDDVSRTTPLLDASCRPLPASLPAHRLNPMAAVFTPAASLKETPLPNARRRCPSRM